MVNGQWAKCEDFFTSTIHNSPFTIHYPSALKISLKIFPADNSSMSPS